jgi:hypothetical protein
VGRGLGTVGFAGHANLVLGPLASVGHRLGVGTRDKWWSQTLEHEGLVAASDNFRIRTWRLGLAEPAVGEERLITATKRSGLLS